MKTTAKKTPYWFISEIEGDEYVHYFDSHEELMNAVVQAIAFSDCSDEDVLDISSGGNIIYYVGWQPGMHYVFKNLDGEVVWDDYYPEYDH